MHASHNSWLVALSIAVAVLVSSIAFRLAARVAEAGGRAPPCGNGL